MSTADRTERQRIERRACVSACNAVTYSNVLHICMCLEYFVCCVDVVKLFMTIKILVALDWHKISMMVMMMLLDNEGNMCFECEDNG